MFTCAGKGILAAGSASQAEEAGLLVPHQHIKPEQLGLKTECMF